HSNDLRLGETALSHVSAPSELAQTLHHGEGFRGGQVMATIAAAGRATHCRRNGLWDVIIDEPQELVAGHVNLVNAQELSTTRSYVQLPEGFRVPFLDATADYRPDEYIVPRPGHEGPINLTELLEMPGKVWPDEIAREATRRFYELMHRPDIHQARLDHEALPLEQGDLVMFSNPILTEMQDAARVMRVEGNLVLLDREVEMIAVQSYAIRFMVIGEPDEKGLVEATSVLRAVRTQPGQRRLLQLLGGGVQPEQDSIVQFGPASADSFPVRVVAAEMGEQFSTVLRLVAAAPEIDELTDAFVAPPWTGRRGDDVGFDSFDPEPPRFAGVASSINPALSDPGGLGSYVDANTTARWLVVRLSRVPGAAFLTHFVLHWRVGTGAWTSRDVPLGSGVAEIEGFELGDVVALYAVAVGFGGAISDPGALITYSVGDGDLALPSSLDADGMIAAGGLGHAVLTIPIPAGDTQQVQIYRVPTGDTLDRDLHAAGAPVPVSAGITSSIVDGDATRRTLVDALETGSDWTPGAGWTLSGVADHGAGAAGALAHPITVSDGQSLRIAFTVSGLTGGTLTPQLSGSDTVSAAAVTADGRHYAELAASGTTAFELLADASFAGQVSDLSVYIRTNTSAPQGAWDYYAEPRDGDIVAAMAGPIPTQIS
ncbi:hypothetical protein ATI53_10621, partial [Salipiger aestuarii]